MGGGLCDCNFSSDHWNHDLVEQAQEEESY
jgi:hypothetical protein